MKQRQRLDGQADGGADEDRGPQQREPHAAPEAQAQPRDGDESEQRHHDHRVKLPDDRGAAAG
ncbi:hypothetical protein [Dactylosporangium sp. NPDC000521]|uniref:hypothetical protein n=1 Tax=Dactylosporangium sp. NPDC000521 TaxID=3363975 RepID=UPI0036C24633